MPQEPILITRNHALLTEFRRAFKSPTPELLPVEGPRLLGEAIRSSLRLEKILFSRTGYEHHGPKLLPQLSKHTTIAVTDDAGFAACMDVEHPQGVAALVKLPVPKIDQVFASGDAPPLIIAAAEMQDPGNLGTLIRAADAFGATGVVALADTVSPYNPKAVRASAGSLFHIPVIAKVSIADLIQACAQRGVRLLATAARGDLDLSVAGLEGPVCIVIGQEGSGVPRELLRAAAGTISIAMVRPIESLNAGVSGAILLFEAARQRRSPAHP